MRGLVDRGYRSISVPGGRTGQHHRGVRQYHERLRADRHWRPAAGRAARPAAARFRRFQPPALTLAPAAGKILVIGRPAVCRLNDTCGAGSRTTSPMVIFPQC
jgi:hypothetical protein